MRIPHRQVGSADPVPARRQRGRCDRGPVPDDEHGARRHDLVVGAVGKLQGTIDAGHDAEAGSAAAELHAVSAGGVSEGDVVDGQVECSSGPFDVIAVVAHRAGHDRRRRRRRRGGHCVETRTHLLGRRAVHHDEHTTLAAANVDHTGDSKVAEPVGPAGRVVELIDQECGGAVGAQAHRSSGG